MSVISFSIYFICSSTLIGCIDLASSSLDDSGGKIQKRHIESIHEGKTFKCDICLSSFKYKGYLKTHVGSFHVGKKFKCGACHSSFTQKSSLKAHIQSVHEGKTFQCDLCSLNFTQK